MKKTFSLIFIFNVIILSFVNGQTLDEARELYKIGQYAKAMPIFEKEYNLKPTDASLNQWYGVCIFETGGDLKKAEELITFASTKGIQDAYYYLGKLYTKTYRFDAAAKEFDRYAKLKRRDKAVLSNLETDKQKLAVLMKAASRPEDIQIIDSVIVDKNSFLSAYKMSLSSGKLINDSNGQIAYLNEKGTKKFYTDVKEDGILSIFSQEKLLDDFGNKKILSEDNLGLSGNLSYPFVMSDGVTIYFAAEDEEGFGGYDIYVTRYNMNNDTYLNPERLNMPFNSSFNDYMYVIDDEKGVGWFATDRFQPKGKICVYTFIPNDKVVILESDEDNYLYSRARIKSIKDSWKPDLSYVKEIALARKEVKEEIQIKKDFEFVVNDKYTYYTLNEFKNPNARSLYSTVLNQIKTLNDINTGLDKLRDSYNTSPSNFIAQEILSLEAQKNKLMEEIVLNELEARNQEVQTF